MKIFIVFMILVFSNYVSADICSVVAGAKVIANDGKYLGSISSEYDANSIFNEYGTYGSEYSVKSIWNKYGAYGGEYSSLSPFNSYTSTPPLLIKDDKVIAHFTVNKQLRSIINPYVLRSCTFY